MATRKDWFDLAGERSTCSSVCSANFAHCYYSSLTSLCRTALLQFLSHSHNLNIILACAGELKEISYRARAVIGACSRSNHRCVRAKRVVVQRFIFFSLVVAANKLLEYSSKCLPPNPFGCPRCRVALAACQQEQRPLLH